jgi:hypothetical protein
MRRTIFQIIALAAVVAAPAALAASNDALSLIPVDAATVAYVKVSDLRTSPLTARVFSEADKAAGDGEAARFMAEAGLRPREDVDAALIALTPAAGKSRILVIFEGRFDPARLSAAVAGRGAEAVSSQFGTYYVVRDQDGDRGGVAFASSRIVIAGHEAAVTQALQAQATRGTDFRTRSLLSRELAKVDPRATAWLLMDVQRSQVLRVEPEWPHAGGEAVGAAMKKVSFLNVWARESGNAVQISATATSDDAETRALLEDALRGLLATWRLSVHEKAPELIPLIRRFRVDRDRSGVNISGTITAEMLQKLQAQHKGKAAAR